jgi:aconitate hydratase
MGILPLEFLPGESPEKLGLDGRESFEIAGLGAAKAQGDIEVVATADSGRQTRFRARIRIDTPQEMEYYRHGGILQYVLRQMIRTPS